MMNASTEESIMFSLSQAFDVRTLEGSKGIILASVATLFVVLILLTVLAAWLWRRRKRRPDEPESAKGTPSQSGSLRKAYESTSVSPRSARPRRHSWRTPPQSRREFSIGPPMAGGLTKGALNASLLFEPAQMENILKNYNMSLPSYKGRLESIEDEGSRSEDDEAPGNYEGPGKISFKLEHKSQILSVHIINCKGLPAHCLWTSRGPQYFRRNPFVRVTLLPDTGAEDERFDTKERHRTLNPNFDEAFEFSVAPHELRDRALRITVFDKEEGRNPKMVGMVIYPLDGVATTSTHEKASKKEESELIVLDLSRHEGASKEEPESLQRRGSSLGEISIGLTCNPLTSSVRINILQMKGVRAPKDIRLAGAYVRVQLFHGHHLLMTKTTNVHRIPRDASDEVSIFESFNFGVPDKFFHSVSLSVTVVAARIPRDAATSRDLVLGNIILGPSMFARGDALDHWEKMMAAPGAMISKWHQLEDPSGFRAKNLLNRGRSRSVDH